MVCKPPPIWFAEHPLRTFVLGLLIAALAWGTPIETANSDSALLLLASQAWLEHHSPDLEVYRDHPLLTYDLDGDYRIRHRDGGSFYFSPVVPLLSVPAVWLARRLGFNMLLLADEAALQDVFSALLTAWIFVLLYQICRLLVGHRAGLVIALLSTLGSMLISTLATGLWSIDFVLVFLLLALRQLVRARRLPGARSRPLYVGILLVAAYACRPTAGFFVVAVVVYGALLYARSQTRRALWWAAAAAVVVALAAVAGWWLLGEQIPEYYSPRRLTAWTPLLHGLQGNLISPSRGLLIFCPFVIVVLAGVVFKLRQLVQQPLFWLLAVWWGSHLLGASIKGYWWGGYSFGPRLLTEMMPPVALLAALVWERLRGPGQSSTVARGWAFAYLLLGVVAIWIHVWQGLFNPAPRLWSVMPDLERNPHLLFDWRHPQFLARLGNLEARYLKHQWLELLPYSFGEAIEPGGERAVFDGWHHPERQWQWSDGTSSLHFRLQKAPRGSSYVLHLEASGNGRQEVELRLDGTTLGRWVYAGFEPQIGRFAFSREAFLSSAEAAAGGSPASHSLQVLVPGAAPASALDGRVVGIALRSLWISPLEAPRAGLGFDAEPYFLDGFSRAEAGWRWTDGERSRLAYPLPKGAAGWDHRLQLRARALGSQRVRVQINGKDLGELWFEGFDASDRSLLVPAAILSVRTPNIIAFDLPDAQRTADDERLLALAVERLELVRIGAAGRLEDSSASPSASRKAR